MLVHADNPTYEGLFDPNDEGPAQILCDSYLDFGCQALLAGGPFTNVGVTRQVLEQQGWQMSDDGEVHSCPVCTVRYARGEHR